jgi:hypothetical protein
MSSMLRLQLLLLVTLSAILVLMACKNAAHASMCGTPERLGASTLSPLPSSWLWASEFPKSASRKDVEASVQLRSDLLSGNPSVVSSARIALLGLSETKRSHLPLDLRAYLLDLLNSAPAPESAQNGKFSEASYDRIRSLINQTSDGIIYAFREGLYLLNEAILKAPKSVPIDLLVWITHNPQFNGKSIKQELGIVALFAHREIGARTPNQLLSLSQSANTIPLALETPEQTFKRQEAMKLLLYTAPHSLNQAALKELSNYDALGAPDLIFDIDLVRDLANKYLSERS